jgi:hypothetical protein
MLPGWLTVCCPGQVHDTSADVLHHSLGIMHRRNVLVPEPGIY